MAHPSLGYKLKAIYHFCLEIQKVKCHWDDC
jgi:hypothetical protein